MLYTLCFFYSFFNQGDLKQFLRISRNKDDKIKSQPISTKTKVSKTPKGPGLPSVQDCRGSINRSGNVMNFITVTEKLSHELHFHSLHLQH